MATRVLTTNEFETWLNTLTSRERKDVLHVVDLLEKQGVLLGRPHSGALEDTDLPLRELRPKAGHSPLRPIYAFDPNRDAVVLIGGDKGADKKMYDRIIPVAEQLWKDHLHDLKQHAEAEAKKKDKKK
jgi:hypothetical protein